jgi:hypothetical protein
VGVDRLRRLLYLLRARLPLVQKMDVEAKADERRRKRAELALRRAAELEARARAVGVYRDSFGPRR